jgi:hypothetical protein
MIHLPAATSIAIALSQCFSLLNLIGSFSFKNCLLLFLQAALPPQFNSNRNAGHKQARQPGARLQQASSKAQQGATARAWWPA